ncbi:hypothetical protein EVAR_33607_1 [Eumeta japonica]|uniref:Uncharacterized protein n=1 Tax=Eumeta variegata TaxID=151549 RepID=A0A4C1WAJ4_EUMVA|nr:hypothetical protein EVAR_33607_1 [Eumeta japonica]
MYSPSASKKSQRSTPRESSCTLPHHTLHALTSPPRVILSVPRFEQPYRMRSRYGLMGLAPSKYTDTTPTLQFSAFIMVAVTFLFDKGLILIDIHVTVQDYDGGLDGSPSRNRLLNDLTSWVPPQLANIHNLGFLYQGYRDFSPVSLNEQLRYSKFTSLQVGLNKPQGYVVSDILRGQSASHLGAIKGVQGAGG